MDKLLLLLKIVLEKKTKKPLGNFHTYRKLNKTNPLTWIFLFISAIFGFIYYGYKGVKANSKGLFTWV